MNDLPPMAFILVGSLTTLFSVFGDSRMKVFIYIGILMIFYGSAKYFFQNRQNSNFCPSCKKKTLKNAFYCHHCGSLLVR